MNKAYRILLLSLLAGLSLSVNAGVLREDTATQVAIGPFLDGTDGITAETALTVTDWDCDIVKHTNSGMAATSLTITASAGSNDAAHLESGIYSLELTATDTNTAGRFLLYCDHATPATFLAVRHEFMVMPTQEYDSLYGTDVLQVHAVEMAAGLITSTTIATDAIGADELAAGGVTEIQSGLATAAALTTVDNEIATIETTIGVAGAGLTEAGGTGDQFTAFGAIALQAGNNGAYPALGIIASGTAQAYTSGTPSVTLASATAAGDDDFNDATIIVLGSNEGDWQPATISDYVGSTDVATIDAAFSTAPTGTISYIVFGTAGGSAGATATEVWAHATRTLTALDEDSTTIDLNGSAVGSVVGAVGSVTGAVGSVTGSVGSVTGAVGSVTGNVGGIAGTITTLDGLDTAQDTQHSTTQSAITALNDLSTAEVNAQVVDALATDTYTQPGSGAPAATEDLASMIAYLYKSWRNRSTQTATTYTLYNDDGSTAEQSATVSDDATTFVKGEVGAP